MELKAQLEALGHRVLVPATAERMAASGDFEVSNYKTWFANPGDYDRKSFLMRQHFAKVVEGDSVLVVNNEKHGQPNYIGGNVLMEMALAFHLEKPIYIFNGLPEGSSFEEEILGFQPVFLEGDLSPLRPAVTV
jgi:hypothetical protein